MQGELIDFLGGQDIQPGHMFYNQFSMDGGKTFQTGFIVKEDLEHLNQLGKYPRFHLRAGLFNYSGVGVVVVMVQINKVFELLYEMMINYFSDQGAGQVCCEDFARQEKLYFNFFIGQERARVIGVDNQVKHYFGLICQIMEKTYSRWSMAAFDQAKLELYNDFDEPIKLWDRLGQGVPINFTDN